MARPCKAAGVLTENSQTKAEIKGRIDNEEKLKGKSDKIIAPEQLTKTQKIIFKFIVDELEESKLLGNLDLYILTNTSIAIDRILQLEYKININPSLMFRKEVISLKKAYSGDFFRGCNELSLSPQSRAKLANLNLQADKDKKNPLLAALEDDEEDEE